MRNAPDQCLGQILGHGAIQPSGFLHSSVRLRGFPVNIQLKNILIISRALNPYQSL